MQQQCGRICVDYQVNAMRLSDELFNEITDSINIIGCDEPREADRRLPRVRLSSHLAIATWADPLSPLSVRVRDLSQGGLGILNSNRIALDEELVIRFPRPEGQTTLVLGKVVYWEPLAENLYCIGVQFERLLDEAELSRQSELMTREQSQQMGVIARFAQSFARTWRIAS